MDYQTSTIRLVYPQWQGGIVAHLIPELAPDDASRGYYLGAQLLNFLAPDNNQKTLQVPVSLNVNDRTIEKGINSYNDILKQTKAALGILQESKPERIVTLGG